MNPDRVGRRTLNRTLLAWQWLHPRPEATALDAIGHTVGLQAQDPKAPYVGLWSRLADFTPDDLSTLLLDRRAVRIVTLRSTVHLHTAADALPVRDWTQAVTENGLRTSRKQWWPLVDRAELVAEVRRLLHDAPVPGADLGETLTARWPQVPAAELQQFARAFVALVQVPPRGCGGAPGARPTPSPRTGSVVRARWSTRRRWSRGTSPRTARRACVTCRRGAG